MSRQNPDREAGGRRDGIEIVKRSNVFDRYSVSAGGQASTLIRPDGYIEWRSESVDIAGCVEFLRGMRA